MAVVPFPRPTLPPASAPVLLTPDGPTPLVRCAGIVHVFGAPRGRCQCGSELWREPGAPAPLDPPPAA